MKHILQKWGGGVISDQSMGLVMVLPVGTKSQLLCRSYLRVRLILAVVLEVAITVVVCQLAAVGMEPALTVFTVVLYLLA